MSYWTRRHLQQMLVRGLECRHRVARLLSALANRDVGHHRTPSSLAGSWSLDLSRSVITVHGSQQHKPFRSWEARAGTSDGKATYLAFVV